jgi:hypothetical protein
MKIKQANIMFVRDSFPFWSPKPITGYIAKKG